MIILQLLFALFLLADAGSTGGKSNSFRKCDLCQSTCPDDKPCSCRAGHSPCCLDCSLEVNCPSGCNCSLEDNGNELYCNQTCEYEQPTPTDTTTPTETPTQSPSEGVPPSTQPTEPVGPCSVCQPSNLDCTIDNHQCGGSNQPKNPCSSGVLAKYECGPSPSQDSCIWHVTCADSTQSPGSLPEGENTTCDTLCSEETRPTQCDASFKLKDSDTNVTSECKNISGSCQWQPTNCVPAECKLNFTNGSFLCGTEMLNCSIPCGADPYSLCATQSDGSCAWTFQCEPTKCQLVYDLTTFDFNKSPSPICGGNLTRPQCDQGMSLSTKAGCSEVESSCEWVDNCEAGSQNQQCFLNKGDNLGWLCGNELVPPFCKDGSRFIPTFCEFFNESCVARGYCDRQTIVPLQSQSSSANQSEIKCSGQSKPSCESGANLLIEPQCQCSQDDNGNTTCLWTSWLCQVQNPCGECEYPCLDNQILAGGNCISSQGNCSWSGLQCIDRPQIDVCTCDDVAPNLCPLGQMRDNSTSPICVKSSGRCQLQSQCTADMCGGFSENMCTCDYSNCVYITTNSTGNDQYSYYDTNYEQGSSGNYEGCFSPNSDVLRAMLVIMQSDIQILSSSPDQCSNSQGPQPAGSMPLQPMAPTLPAANSSCANCQMIVDQVRQRCGDQSRLTAAHTVLSEEQLYSQQTVDNQTGSCLARQFEVDVVAVGKPRIRQNDNSLDITLVTFFRPLEFVQQPIDAHKRVFCIILYRYVASILEIDLNDINSTNTTNGNMNDTNSMCQWLTMNTTGSGQNMSSTTNNYFAVLLNIPESLLQQFSNSTSSQPNSPSSPTTPPTSTPQQSPNTANTQVRVNITNSPDQNGSGSLAVNIGLLLTFIGAFITLF